MNESSLWARGPRASDITVTVYGAGVSGLTVAHELAEHGFRVRVVEPERALRSDGRPDIAIGGLARSQFGRAPRLRSPADVPELPRKLDTAASLGEVEVGFASGSAELDPAAQAELGALLERSRIEFADYRLRVDAGRAGDALARGRAEAIRRYLIDVGGVADERVITVETARAATDEPTRVGIDAIVLPGEHGFRFFPSYYRHVFDSMRRIPLVDDDGRLTGETVLDRLVSTPVQAMVREGQAILLNRRTPTRSSALLRDELDGLRELGYTHRDLAQFLVRVLRYMCTSNERRAGELASISWWQYLCGYDPHTRTCRHAYSEAFTRDTLFSTRVLAAFDAEWGDAHTNGDTYVQLFLNRLVERERCDAVLDGPTSSAWLEPWRAHLERLEVEFHVGELERLELADDGRVDAWVREPGSDVATIAERSDYIVVATDVTTAEAVSQTLPRIGVPGDLRGFTTRVEGPRANSEPVTEARDPRRACGLAPWDRLQTLTGVQFFFAHADVKVARGHLYFLDAPWGLSAISSQQFWREPPQPDRAGYRSLLSVDVGEWTTPARGPAGEPIPCASELGLEAMAAEVYRQVSAGLEAAIGRLPTPTWFHVDTTLVEHTDGPSGVTLENRSPYLIPIVGDWARRPAGEPWVPGEAGPRFAEPRPEPGAWQADHGGYLVHFGGLVFAGTYMRTFTRMTTMESANESGRHAANAIIDHVLETRLGCERGPHVARPSQATRVPPAPPPAPTPSASLEGPDERGDTRVFATTPLGDYSAIWPLGDYELPDLMPARRYDAELFARGLPHPWDFAGIETMLVLACEGDIGGDLAGLLERILAALRAGLAGTPDAQTIVRATLDGLRSLRQRLADQGSA